MMRKRGRVVSIIDVAAIVLMGGAFNFFRIFGVPDSLPQIDIGVLLPRSGDTGIIPRLGSPDAWVVSEETGPLETEPLPKEEDTPLTEEEFALEEVEELATAENPLVGLPEEQFARLEEVNQRIAAVEAKEESFQGNNDAEGIPLDPIALHQEGRELGQIKRELQLLREERNRLILAISKERPSRR
jgi:hypothetical protein